MYYSWHNNQPELLKMQPIRQSIDSTGNSAQNHAKEFSNSGGLVFCHQQNLYFKYF